MHMTQQDRSCHKKLKAGPRLAGFLMTRPVWYLLSTYPSFYVTNEAGGLEKSQPAVLKKYRSYAYCMSGACSVQRTSM